MYEESFRSHNDVEQIFILTIQQNKKKNEKQKKTKRCYLFFSLPEKKKRSKEVEDKSEMRLSFALLIVQFFLFI